MTATPPAGDSTTTAYWVLSDSCGTDRGSMRMAVPPCSPVTVCWVTREPSANRYQLSLAVVTHTEVAWMTIGVVQPCGPPSVLVTFGRNHFVRYGMIPLVAMAVAGLVVAASIATCMVGRP